MSGRTAAKTWLTRNRSCYARVAIAPMHFPDVIGGGRTAKRPIESQPAVCSPRLAALMNDSCATTEGWRPGNPPLIAARGLVGELRAAR